MNHREHRNYTDYLVGENVIVDGELISVAEYRRIFKEANTKRFDKYMAGIITIERDYPVCVKNNRILYLVFDYMNYEVAEINISDGEDHQEYTITIYEIDSDSDKYAYLSDFLNQYKDELIKDPLSWVKREIRRHCTEMENV